MDGRKKRGITVTSYIDIGTLSKFSYLQMIIGDGSKSAVVREAINVLYEKHRDEKSDKWCGISHGNQDR